MEHSEAIAAYNAANYCFKYDFILIALLLKKSREKVPIKYTKRDKWKVYKTF